MAHTGGNIVLHLIFSTKRRQPLIGNEIREDLFAYLGGIVREMRGSALIINGTADHVHMLVRIRPAHSTAEIVRVVKANSSRWMHEKWKMKFAWQTGYGVFSVSESNVSAVSRYIADQERHQNVGVGGRPGGCCEMPHWRPRDVVQNAGPDAGEICES